jgi:hypothetical protein
MLPMEPSSFAGTAPAGIEILTPVPLVTTPASALVTVNESGFVKIPDCGSGVAGGTPRSRVAVPESPSL